MEREVVNIAICDDDYKVQFLIEDGVTRMFDEYGKKAIIECFDTGDDLCESYKKERFDLIFLDIEFKGKSGVEVGRYIRDIIKDEVVQIAYISGNTSYAMELFESRPINFLKKPISESDLKRVVNKFLIINEQKKDVLRIKIGREIYSIPFSDIVYMTSRGRKITLYGVRNKYEFYDTLDAVYKRIKFYRFLFVHKSYIVNYNYIKKISYNNVVLINNDEIPISQSRRAIIRKQLMNIEREGYNE